MFKTIGNDDLKGAVFLVLANKQDLRDAMPAGELSTKLGLHNIRDHNWHIQSCSAKEGTGLKEGFDWLAQQVQEAKAQSDAAQGGEDAG